MYASEIFFTMYADNNCVLALQVVNTGVKFPPIYHGLKL